MQNNLISGNDQGVVVSFSSTGNFFENNIIGLQPDGVTPLPNSGNGIGFTSGSSFNTITENLISNNTFSGITISALGGTNSDSITVQGNFIGTDITGTLDRGNVLGKGISTSTDFNQIGGTGAGEGNLISGN
ncbi:MAG: hypothetical protein M3P98_03060 [bacterium]|nr:hypothetical protein [bacterium]